MPREDLNSSYFDPMAPEVHDWGRWKTGVGPGLLAGTVMAIILAILALARGVSVFHPVRVIASTVLGERAMTGGLGTVVVGTVLHFGLSAVLGAAFTLVFGRTTMRRSLGFGLFYGLVLWLVAQLAILPLVNPIAATQLGTLGTFLLAHLAYGLMLAACVPTVRDIDAPRHGYLDPLRREIRP